MNRRPTKSDLVREARTALTDTPPTDNVTAPFEPASAEVGEAFDLSEPETYAAGMPEDDNDWFADDAQAFDESLDNESLDEPDDIRQRFNLESATDTAPSVNPIPASTLRPVSPAGTLIAHCGTRKISRDELAIIPAPPLTRTHQPVAHSRVVKLLEEALAFRHVTVTREEFAVSGDGMRCFGVLDLSYQYASFDSFRFSIGMRNSNDKTMRLGLTIGARVTVCDNMMFKGDFTPVLAKHSKRLDLEETIVLGVERMQRGFSPLREQIEVWQGQALSDSDAKLLIYEAFLDRGLPLPKHLMSVVHRHYFAPEYEEFKSRTLWSLTNAFTSAFKLLKPVQQFQATAKLGGFLARRDFNASDTGALVAAAREAVALGM